MGELCAEELVGLADLAGNVVGRGHRGAMPIGGGAVFQRRTLECRRRLPGETEQEKR